MDIICRSRDLEKALRIAQGATNAQTNLKTGVGMNALLEATDGRLHITTTDLSVAITTQIEATVRRTGRASLLHALLHRISGTVTEPMTELAVNGSRSTLVCGSIRATMFGDRPENFPKVALQRPIANAGRSIKASRLHSAIANAAAGGQPEGDQTRPAANARVDLGPDAIVITTNAGSKAGQAKLTMENEPSCRQLTAIVPIRGLMKAIPILQGNADDAWIELDEDRSRLYIDTPTSAIAIQTASAVRGIPDPEIPEPDPDHTQLTIRTERFRNAVSASEAFAKEGPELVELTTRTARDGTAQLSIRVADALLGEIRDRVNAQQASGPNALVLIETNHLRQISRLVPGSLIQLTVRGEEGPVTFMCPRDEDVITHMTVPSRDE